MNKKKKNIIIVGNSGAARECYGNLKEVMKFDKNLVFKGFLSFEGYQADLKELNKYFLGIDDDYTFLQNDYIIIGLGSPKLRKKAFEKLKSKGVNLYNLIHPNCVIDENVELGEGNIITTDCFLSCDCKIGNGNYFNGYVNMGHDVKIGDFNFFGPSSHLLGSVRVGNLNNFGTMSILLTNSKIGDENIISPLSAVYKGCRNKCYMHGNPALNIGSVED